MSHQQTHTAPQQQPKQSTPVAPSAPLPLDPSLLRQVSGGASTSGPFNNW